MVKIHFNKIDKDSSWIQSQNSHCRKKRGCLVLASTAEKAKGYNGEYVKNVFFHINIISGFAVFDMDIIKMLNL